MALDAGLSMYTQLKVIRVSTDVGDSVSPGEIGGKAWQLRRLEQAGLPVPRWFVVSTGAFASAVTPIRGQLSGILSGIRAADLDTVRTASADIAKLFANLIPVEEHQAELKSAVYQMFGITGRLAVRSSAVGEDASAHSFAGQLDSFLNVAPDRVEHAIINVWRSAFSERALAYRLHAGLPLDQIKVAVIVQQMIPAERSGVIFTRDPESLRKEVVIEAAYGLGEGVVANRAETDSYRFGWSSLFPTSTIRVKHTRMVPTHLPIEKVTCVPVHESLRSRSVLSYRDLRRLRALALKIENLRGAPQDIEWCFDAHRRLFIVQSRPITPGMSSSGAAYRIWDNANIIESYPGLTLPLTFSFISANYEQVFRNAARGLVISKGGVEKRTDIWKNMVGLIEGRVYYNLLNWYAMLSFLPGFKRHHRAWDQMIGIKRRIDVKAARLPWYNRIRAALTVLGHLCFVGAAPRRFFAHFNPLYARYRRIDCSTLDESALANLFERMQRELMQFWHLTLYADFCALKYYDWLASLCRWAGVPADLNLHSDLLCGGHPTESVRAIESAVTLAEQVRENPLYSTLFADQSDETVWQKLDYDPAYVNLKQPFRRHLEQYGDRTTEELKLETRTPREKPEKLVSLVRSYLAGECTVEGLHERERRKCLTAERRLADLVGNPVTRLLIQIVRAKARQSVAARENMRFARTRMYGIVRGVFRRYGDLLANRKAIETPDDIAYLTIQEIFGYANATTMAIDLKTLVRGRKNEYRQFREKTLPDRFETNGPPALCDIQSATTWDSETRHLSGIGCSSGVADGCAVVVRDPSHATIRSDQILVAESTDPSWVFLMLNSKGVVVERGSILSHTAIVGRELGIPTVVGVANATRLIPSLARVRINGGTGEVVWQ
ncbi:MAG: hypothetical protein HY851_02570 [candidate division Zixibacteria bacterium]|nr:hypothetical protein [candidate division Zixibacteria bacterium]